MTRQPAIKLDTALICRNLMRWYDRATDEQMQDGLHWYDAALTTCVGIATQAGVPLTTAAAVTAAISPRMVWSQNVTAALAICLNPNAEHTQTFECNVTKARRIMAGEEPLNVLRGNKVTAFYRNLLGDMDAVTVDGWIAQAAAGLSSNHRLTDGQYATIANAIRSCAANVGLTPASFQAVVWCSIRGSGK